MWGALTAIALVADPVLATHYLCSAEGVECSLAASVRLFGYFLSSAFSDTMTIVRYVLAPSLVCLPLITWTKRERCSGDTI